MRTRLARPLRLGVLLVAALGLVLGLGLGLGLGRGSHPVEATEPAAPPAATSPAPSSSTATVPPPGRLAEPTGTTGGDGLTVRHLGPDGTVRTVRVEDFRR